jgi:O-antigen ligase
MNKRKIKDKQKVNSYARQTKGVKKSKEKYRAGSGGNRTKGFIFWGFLIVLLPLVHYTEAQDTVLLPRLLISAVFLFVFFLVFIPVKNNALTDKAVIWDYLVVSAFIYLLATVISSFFAINFRESLFDISKTFIFLTVIIISYYMLKKNREYIELLPFLFLISTLFLLFLGYYQYFKLVYFSDEEFLPNGLPVIYHVKGLMAHKNLYSSALFLLLPFTIFGIFRTKGRMRLLFSVASAGTLFILILLSTRAVWLGIIIAVLIAVAIILLLGKRFGLSAKFRAIVLGAGLLVFSIGALYISGTSSSSEYSVTERFKSIFDPEASNNRYRLNVWEASLEIWSDNPVFGIGAGNWKIEVIPFFHRYNFNKEQLNWNRPHNDYLWVLTEKGLLGFIAYLGMFIAAFFHLLRIINRSEDKENRLLALILCSGLAGYLSISFFDFPLERVYHQIIIAIWFSVLLVMKEPGKTATAVQVNNAPVSYLLLAGFLFVAIYSYSAVKLEVIVKKTFTIQQTGNWRRMLNLAVSIPSGFRNIDANNIPVYYYHGLANEGLKNYGLAEKYYLRAHKDHPSSIQVMNNLGLVYYLQNNLDEARKYYEKALTILPDYYEALINISTLCIDEGNYQQSLDYLELIPKERWDERFYERERALKQYIDKNRH